MEYAIIFLPLIGSILGYLGRSINKFFSEVFTSILVSISAILSIVIFWNGIQYGTVSRTPTSGYHNESRSHGCARFWFNGSQSFGVQHKCDSGQSSSYGFGSGQRENPRFTEVTCLKYVYDVAGATP